MTYLLGSRSRDEPVSCHTRIFQSRVPEHCVHIRIKRKPGIDFGDSEVLLHGAICAMYILDQEIGPPRSFAFCVRRQGPIGRLTFHVLHLLG